MKRWNRMCKNANRFLRTTNYTAQVDGQFNLEQLS